MIYNYKTWLTCREQVALVQHYFSKIIIIIFYYLSDQTLKMESQVWVHLLKVLM